MNGNNSNGTDSSANTRINGYWERAAIFLMFLVMGYMQVQYQEQKADAKELENKVFFLYSDKVSNQQLQNTEDRLVKNIEGMRSDLLARLDLYFGSITKPNK